MAISDDLKAEVNKIIKERWTISEGRVVPDTPDIELGNNGVKLDVTCLYADLAESTALVDAMPAEFAAEVYKCYLNCACRIIRDRGGEITAFDGDRVMAVFVGDNKNTSAVRAALAIDHAVEQIINPAIGGYYNDQRGNYRLRHGVGIDTSEVLVARTGIRGSNDLVWVGRAANYAAKLCALRTGNYCTYITGDVYDSMNQSIKYSGSQNRWEEREWTAKGGLRIFRTNWFWGL